MTTFPSLFISHGAPNLPLTKHAAKRFLTGLGARLPRPKAILIVSAHWEAGTPTLGTAHQPATIHDFFGFEPELHQMRYPARTDQELIDRAEALLDTAGIQVRRHPTRGYDHGVWVPLILAYPDADIPVVQLSLRHPGDAPEHLEMGRALAPLRREGVLVIGSGSAVHNLRAMAPEGSATPDWAVAFNDWVDHAVTTGDIVALSSFPRVPETAFRAHPTPEHFLPLLVAVGAGGADGIGRRIHQSFSYGSISMASFAFGEAAVVEHLQEQEEYVQ